MSGILATTVPLHIYSEINISTRQRWLPEPIQVVRGIIGLNKAGCIFNFLALLWTYMQPHIHLLKDTEPKI